MVGKIKHFGLKAGKRFTNGDDRFFAGICLIPIGAFKLCALSYSEINL
jgi:hypothetical protein